MLPSSSHRMENKIIFKSTSCDLGEANPTWNLSVYFLFRWNPWPQWEFLALTESAFQSTAPEADEWNELNYLSLHQYKKKILQYGVCFHYFSNDIFSSKRCYFSYEINTCWVVSYGMKPQVPKYLEDSNNKKFSSFVSTFEFQWILIIIKQDASSEMTNNNLKSCQNDIPLLWGKYCPSQTDKRHYLHYKIAVVHFIEKMDSSQQSRTVGILVIHIPYSRTVFCEFKNEN